MPAAVFLADERAWNHKLKMYQTIVSKGGPPSTNYDQTIDKWLVKYVSHTMMLKRSQVYRKS